ncbi:MAG: MFS transporter [Chloroflexi bacterium]|nr:MFS transporter [Chloroflexota bacterium]
MDATFEKNRQYFLYSSGTLGTATLSFLINSWLLYFYLPPDGPALVPVALYGTAILVGRVISGLLSPLIGHWSDRSQSRWGRRLPFMFFSILPMLGAFLLLWMPPDTHASYWNLAYLLLVVIVFRIAAAFYAIPYQALLPEIAREDRPRVKISAWQSAFFIIGILSAGLAGVLIDAQGYRSMAVVFAVFVWLVLCLPIYGLRQQAFASDIQAAPPALWSNITAVFQNRAFVAFTFVWAFYLMTSSLIQAVAPFLVTEVCGMREADTVYFYVPAVAASLLCFPLVMRLSNRWGKTRVYGVSLVGSTLIFPATMLIGDWLPIGLRVQCILWAVLQSVAISGAVVLSAAFMAEIIDFDEKVTGLRREGLYYSVIKVLEQIFSGLAMVLLPVILLLGRSRTAPQGPLGVRMVGVVSGVLIGVGFLIFLRYPLRQDEAVK